MRGGSRAAIMAALALASGDGMTDEQRRKTLARMKLGGMGPQPRKSRAWQKRTRRHLHHGRTNARRHP